LYPKSPSWVISLLEDWWCEWYLDRELLSLFISTLGETSDISRWPKQSPTDYRINRYISHLEHWEQLISHIDEMEVLYDGYRGIWVSIDTQKALTQHIDTKRLELHRDAKLTNIIILERHELTDSDSQGRWVPGDQYEWLNDTGINNAQRKGNILKHLSLWVYTSPLPRARETAKLICQNIHDCIGECLWCTRIQSIKSLTNPIKNREDGQHLSLISKFINSWDSQKELLQLVLNIISSSGRSTHLIITHGDIIRHLMLLMENLFARDRFTWIRHPVEHDRVYTLLFEWDQIIPWNLLFSISNWVVMLTQINEHTERIFGDVFYLRGDRQVSLIRLRDRFLDYIDRKNETDPEKVWEFIQALDEDPLTAHFSAILRREGLIE
jgi:broad specificity phosphatase PhoE